MERLLVECAIRSTLIAAATAAVLTGMRIKNVLAHHSAWAGVLVFMLALPLLVAFGYPVPLRVLPPERQNMERVEPSSDGKIPSILPQINSALSELPQGKTKPGHLAWRRWIEGIYLFGVGVLLLRVMTGTIGAYRVKRQARPLDGRLTSTSCSSPITVGWVHAVTILPEGWQDWEPAKLHAVMIHEKEHARRHDPLVQWLALVNRAIFWFHPLAWWLERRLAALSEEACDLAVLERGHHASDYCRYLLDVANSVRASRRRIRFLGMAMPGAYLPERIQKILKGGVAPKVSFLRMAFATAIFFVLSVGLSTATLVRAQNTKTTAIGAEIVVQPPGSGTLTAITENAMPLQIGDKLRALAGVKAVAPVMIKTINEDGIEVIYGIDSHFGDVTGGFHWRKGGLFKAADEIVVDDLWASVHNLKSGDSATILNHPFKVAGVVEHGQGARVFMSIDDLSSMTGQQSQAGVFFVKVQNPDQVTAVSAEIHQLLPGYTVRALHQFETSALPAIQRSGTAGILQAQTPLTRRALIFEAASVRPPGSHGVKVEQGNEESKRVSEQPNDEALLLQRAKDLGFNGDIEVLKTMERMRQEQNLPTMEALEKDMVSRGLNPDEVKRRTRTQYLTTRVLESEVYGQMPFPTNDDIRRYYDAHAQDFNRPAGVHLREITIITGNREPDQIESQRRKAEAALSAVKKGDDFREVAAKYSESRTAQQGGDLGFLVKGQMSPELEEIANKLEKGQVSDIIQVQGAFMIIKVDDKHLGGILPIEMAQKEISDILWREAVQPKIREYLTKLRTSGR